MNNRSQPRGTCVGAQLKVWRCGFWLAAALAIAVEGSAPSAGLYLARCISDGWRSWAMVYPDRAFVELFPWTTAVMLAMCAPSYARNGKALLWAALGRAGLMAVLMPPACAVALALSSIAPRPMTAVIFLAVMLGVMLLASDGIARMLARSRRTLPHRYQTLERP